jgi:hypothetical protein
MSRVFCETWIPRSHASKAPSGPKAPHPTTELRPNPICLRIPPQCTLIFEGHDLGTGKAANFLFQPQPTILPHDARGHSSQLPPLHHVILSRDSPPLGARRIGNHGVLLFDILESSPQQQKITPADAIFYEWAADSKPLRPIVVALHKNPRLKRLSFIRLRVPWPCGGVRDA